MFRPSLSLQFGGCSTPLELGKRAIKTKVAQSKTHAPQRTKTKTLFARLFREGTKKQSKRHNVKVFFCLYAHPWTVSLANGEQAQGSGNFIHITYTFMYIHLPPSPDYFLAWAWAWPTFWVFVFTACLFLLTLIKILAIHTHIVLRSPSLKHKDIGENKNREYVGEKQKLSCWQPHAVEFFSMPQRLRVCECVCVVTFTLLPESVCPLRPFCPFGAIVALFAPSLLKLLLRYAWISLPHSNFALLSLSLSLLLLLLLFVFLAASAALCWAQQLIFNRACALPLWFFYPHAALRSSSLPSPSCCLDFPFFPFALFFCLLFS